MTYPSLALITSTHDMQRVACCAIVDNISSIQHEQRCIHLTSGERRDGTKQCIDSTCTAIAPFPTGHTHERRSTHTTIVRREEQPHATTVVQGSMIIPTHHPDRCYVCSDILRMVGDSHPASLRSSMAYRREPSDEGAGLSRALT